MFVRQLKAPVIHIITPSEAYLLPFLQGKRIITYHDLGTVFSARNRIFKIARKFLHILPSKYFADEITFVSEQTKNEYINVTGYKKRERLHVIYNAYDERLIPTNSIRKNDKFTILSVGTAKRKNLLSTIRAIRGLDIKLSIVGKLNEEQKLELKTNQIDYENMYDIAYEEIIEQYNRCDIVCFPTFYEGFGCPLIEANAMEKPIVAGDIPVLHEIGDKAAYFVNPNSVEEIRKAIVDLMENSSLRNMYIQAGKKNIERFAHSAIASDYGLLYKSVLSNR